MRTFQELAHAALHQEPTHMVVQELAERLAGPAETMTFREIAAWVEQGEPDLTAAEFALTVLSTLAQRLAEVLE